MVAWRLKKVPPILAEVRFKQLVNAVMPVGEPPMAAFP
jgi:hypothetical protein